METKPAISIFFHNYYGDHENWIRFFREKLDMPFDLHYNIADGSPYNLKDDSLSQENAAQRLAGGSLQKLFIRRSPNQGKDIGGKLVLVDSYMRIRRYTPYIIFLHDKKSPHKALGKEWNNKLFRLLEPEFVQKALATFAGNPDTGMVAVADTIQNEHDPSSGTFSSSNRSLLNELVAKYGISDPTQNPTSQNSPAEADYRYVAGTMFWVRAEPLAAFFKKYAPLDIRRTLEKGNVMDENRGSNAHAWERMLSWLIFAQNFNIKGL